jgi:diguanylate cyclase (GGDEF)-like protein
MNRFTGPNRRYLPHVLVALAFGSYIVIFASYHNQLGTGIASLATIPVVVTGWYFGVRGGIAISILVIVVTGVLQSSADQPLETLLTDPGNILRAISLLLVAVVTGRLSNIKHENEEGIRRLEQYHEQRRSYTRFLELLNGITSRALEADSLQSTLEILTEEITRLFNADDGFFAFWDSEQNTPIPIAAYGSMKETYPKIRFEPGEHTLIASVMKAGTPIPVSNIYDSPYISPRIAALFPSRSMLGVPLIAQRRKLGVLVLGYNKHRVFDENEIASAGMMAVQFALVLSKSQVLEDERKQVRQLTALHDVALTSIEADHEDQLIERMTEIIGQNLYPDNFGILLTDGYGEFLRVHPSYRFLATDPMPVVNIPIGQGITGEVIRTGKPLRVGNVHLHPGYLNVDDRISSEVCVPIKFKERILGVINAESVEKDAFSFDDERLLVTLAGQIATAIEQLRKAQAERNWLDQLAHSNDLIYAIAQISTNLEATLSMEEIIQRVGAELQKIDLTCIVAIHDPERDIFTINYTSMTPEHLGIVDRGLGYPMLHYTFPRGKLTKDSVKPAAISSPEDEIESLFTDTEKPGVLRILGEIGITPFTKPIRLPLTVEDTLLGVIWIWGSDVRQSDLPILSIFARQVGVSLERARLFQEVNNLAITDPLTGLHNRRSLFDLGRIEFSRAERFNRPFSALMLDLDHFKRINDNHGHPAGDIVLQEFVRLCRETVREIDLVGRYGGEEFIILMPETDLATATMVAERIRAHIEQGLIPLEGRFETITVSIGVAARDENTTDLETLIARADQAMYIAKHRGRNRVAVSR